MDGAAVLRPCDDLLERASPATLLLFRLSADDAELRTQSCDVWLRRGSVTLLLFRLDEDNAVVVAAVFVVKVAVVGGGGGVDLAPCDDLLLKGSTLHLAKVDLP